jgi:hypothetical protein
MDEGGGGSLRRVGQIVSRLGGLLGESPEGAGYGQASGQCGKEE